MCGIIGIIEPRGIAAEHLHKLSANLRHRGPDGEGRYVGDDTGLVQTRLAIIDLETGDQPIYGPDGEAGPALVANAEVYNYLELREAMPDIAFRAQDLRVVQRALLQDFEIGKDVGPQCEFDALLWLQSTDQIRAKADVNAGIPHVGHSADSLVFDERELRHRLSRIPEPLAIFSKSRDHGHGRYNFCAVVRGHSGGIRFY